MDHCSPVSAVSIVRWRDKWHAYLEDSRPDLDLTRSEATGEEMMEHEMRLAVLTLGLEDHAHPMVMPYCVGCGWVGERCFTFAAESISADWRTHVKEFNESEDGRKQK